MVSLVRKIYNYFKSELKPFSDIYGDSMVAEKHRNPIRDPAFIAYILGEETVQVVH